MNALDILKKVATSKVVSNLGMFAAKTSIVVGVIATASVIGKKIIMADPTFKAFAGIMDNQDKK